MERFHEILSKMGEMNDEEFEKYAELSRLTSELYPPPSSRPRSIQNLPNSVSPDLLASNPSTSEVDSQP